MGDPRPLETLRAAGLEPEEEAAVAANNAIRLLGPEPARREEQVT
jgi:hypothetical protein